MEGWDDLRDEITYDHQGSPTSHLGEGSLTQQEAKVRNQWGDQPVSEGWHLSARGQPGVLHLESSWFYFFAIFFLTPGV